MTSGQKSFPLIGSHFKFQQHGQSGAWVSALLPHTARIADDLCFVKSMHADAVNHAPAISLLLSGAQILFLRALSRRTWAFFDTFVGPEDHWLPPDNYQKYRVAAVAHRTSPTNIGMALLANLSAYDFGYLSTGQLVERTANTLRTLHALLGARPDTRRFRHHAGNPLDVDVVIVDEASMVHLEMMAALLEALPHGARLVLLGDKDQLASVEAGAVLGDLCRDASDGRYDAETARYLLATTGEALPTRYLEPTDKAPALAQHTVMLRESRRFEGPIALPTGMSTGVELRLSTPDSGGGGRAQQGPEVSRVLDAIEQHTVRRRIGVAKAAADRAAVADLEMRDVGKGQFEQRQFLRQ